ncbi:nucleolar protein 10 [Hydra vulgaris]|uniref:nucleolar protein 10 n=1 Tax=Hydra vulgaris TaxID=6087 RepID=UPI001F5F21A8|nr:nucleolar protein 10 [Hydra vulgaris]
MLVSQANNVKVYNLSSGKSLPEWISDRKKRQLLKNDTDLRRRIELIQDFDMPTSSNCVQVSPDGQYIITTGVYKPRLKCFQVDELSLKFDRCFDSECIKFEFLSEDFSKLVLLQADRYVEMHAQYGRYYRTRMPKFGRDLAYHKPSCDLYLVGDGPEVFRLNLEQGRFLQPFDSEVNEINVCKINPDHQMLACGSEDGKVVCFDPRSRLKIGTLDLAMSGVKLGNDLLSSVTALTFRNGLEMAVGTSNGSIMIFDIRSNKPRLVKNHLYELPIKNIVFHGQNNRVLSTDSKILKIWDHETGDNFTSVEPGVTINDMCVYKNSGLIFLANESSKNSVYYIPALGQAPKWCSFLDNITEELEESNEVLVYDDYKFVTDTDLDNLGLSHLRGTGLVRAYMHGFFIDMRLYHKAKSIVEPFAYEEYRKNRIKTKLEEERSSRIKVNKMPKINRHLAEKLLDQKANSKKDDLVNDISNPLGDDRFGAMFMNKDFQVDMESEEYKLLHPVVSKHEKERLNQQSDKSENDSDDDLHPWHTIKSKDKKKKMTKKQKNAFKLYSMQREDLNHSVSINGLKKSSVTIGEILSQDFQKDIIRESGTALGSKEMTFKLSSKRDTKKEEENKIHKKERKDLRRSAGKIVASDNKPKFWRGKKVR